MSGEATPPAAATPPASTGPVKVDALNPSVVIPVYVGGEGPVPTPPAGDRGDTVAPAVPASAPAAAVAVPATPAATPEPVAPAAAATPAAEPAAPDATAAPAAEVTPPVETPSAEAAQPARNEKGQFIPRSRFNEVNEERKRLAEENAALKAEKGATTAATESAYDFDAAEREHANLVLDGKIDEAVKKRAEIRAAEQAQYLKAAQQTTVDTTQRLTVQQQIDQISTRYEQALPQFDPESEQYNDELLADVQSFYIGALESGRYADAATAFQASIDKALKTHGLAFPVEAPAAPAAAPAAAAPATPAAPARTAENRVKAIVSQPPSLAGVGTSGAPETHATIDVKNLTEKDLAALPPATKARLRGDFV